MTKGRAALPGRLVAEQEPFFITLGGPKAHDSSVEKHLQEKTAEPQISPLRFAPVEMIRRGWWLTREAAIGMCGLQAESSLIPGDWWRR